MDVDDLYALPNDRFVPERGTLAKALRADGRRDEAKDVAALRKPSVAAWAINQLVRTQGDAVDELVAAGDALRGAHADLVGGRGDVQALRTATERERGAVDTLLDAVRRLLCPDGPALSDAVVERVADTLHSAALDDDAREQVRGGRLERELRHVGLGLGEGAAAPAKAQKRGGSPRRAAAPKGQPVTRGEEAERRERAEAERAEGERAQALEAARAAGATARRRDERAARALRAAEERRDKAEQALRDADAQLDVARKEADDAAGEHRRARDELDRARETLG